MLIYPLGGCHLLEGDSYGRFSELVVNTCICSLTDYFWRAFHCVRHCLGAVDAISKQRKKHGRCLCLKTGFPEQKRKATLSFSICEFLWCQYCQHNRFQAFSILQDKKVWEQLATISQCEPLQHALGSC